jgi:hypothetical protein
VALFSRPRRALVSSAFKLSGRPSPASTDHSGSAWQRSALEYYDRIGELRYASQFYARQLSRVRCYPARQLPDGTTEPIEEGAPVELLNRIQDPGGGRSRLQYDYGRLMFVTGEGVLYGSNLDEPTERWRFLWKEEVKRDTTTGKMYRESGAGKRVEGEGETEGYRMWTSHPAMSDNADSPMRAVLDIAEELVLLTASVRATAVTRLTNGMLAIASEISPNPDIGGADDDPEANPFLRSFIEHLKAQIENPGSAEARVPFLLEGGYEWIKDGIKWIQMHDPQTDYLERDLRVEAVKRLALGLDMPPEVLLGMSDANHWTAKQVQHDMWASHGVTRAEQFVDDLNEAYLRPALQEAGETWEDVVIAFDDSQVVVSPDRSADALEVFKVGGLSWDALREQTGFSEKDAPSDEELQKIASIITRNPQLIQDSFDIEAPSPAPFPTGPPPTANGKPDPSQGPPSPKPGRVVSREEARTASILGAAAMALRQCRAKAGARLRSHHTSCEECAEKTEGIPNSLVASALGLEQLQEMGEHDPINLVRGGTDEFMGILEEWGIEKTQATVLCQRLETYAAHTLFEPRQPELPPGFTGLIEQNEIPNVL